VSLDYIDNRTEMLCEGPVTLLNAKGTRYVSLMHKLFLKQKKLARMESDEDYVPVSARLAFKVQAWKEAEVLPEFTALIRDTATFIKQFQLQLQANIIANIRLELEFLK
jgi:hypothetical protein